VGGNGTAAPHNEMRRDVAPSKTAKITGSFRFFEGVLVLRRVDLRSSSSALQANSLSDKTGKPIRRNRAIHSSEQ